MGPDKAKNESVKKPGKDDVHEQRDKKQPREGVVGGARAPLQSQADRDRADWEGMGQAQIPADEEAVRPRPGANSIAGQSNPRKG